MAIRIYYYNGRMRAEWRGRFRVYRPDYNGEEDGGYEGRTGGPWNLKLGSALIRPGMFSDCQCYRYFHEECIVVNVPRTRRAARSTNVASKDCSYAAAYSAV
jgi:hypothetical protein